MKLEIYYIVLVGFLVLILVYFRDLILELGYLKLFGILKFI